ncbi:MAG: 3-deoxy-7-phosphoheptulonate synthase [Gammaproteobacteria bacterium]|jgi:3-deoxy-7-phosphoheptulonate synthase|nr:3-deoxy-7-phosphoheptulonate synthase [Gammaproteobacteria bacterium]
MIVIMKAGASAEAIAAVEERLRSMGLDPHASRGKHQTVIGALGDERTVEQAALEALPEVDRIVRVMRPYKFVSREGRDRPSVVEVRGIPIGGVQLQVIAGPCSVETPEQMEASAAATVAAGCRLMRGGAFKPRTSPYAFQGKGVDGLAMLRDAAARHGLPVVTELMDVRMLDTFLEYGVDVIQIGTRNMQNFELLKEVGRTHTPVVLKRGFSATISEWLMAAEYVAAGGNHNIIFCERGVRSFEDAYRNMLDVTAIPVLKRETHLPVIIDPSHAGGKAWMVPALARAAIAAGADGLLVEMHPRPTEAWSDADQALSPDELATLMGELRGIATVLGRTL